MIEARGTLHTCRVWAGALLRVLCLTLLSGCGAGLSDLDWRKVQYADFVPKPQAAEPGERVRALVEFDVPTGTRVTSVEVDQGLFYELYHLGPCDGELSPPTASLELCITLCVDEDAEKGDREIRVSTITGDDDELVGRGDFVILRRYGDEPGPCADPG